MRPFNLGKVTCPGALGRAGEERSRSPCWAHTEWYLQGGSQKQTGALSRAEKAPQREPDALVWPSIALTSPQKKESKVHFKMEGFRFQTTRQRIEAGGKYELKESILKNTGNEV